MKISLLLVAGENKRFIAEAIEAANASFPGATLRAVTSLGDAIGTEAAGSPELLVLGNSPEAEVGEAGAVLDSYRLPRWAVVAMGSGGPVEDAEVVPEAEWNAGLLARVFRSSIALHLLRRERDQLRGDLLSFGIRIGHDLRTPVGGILSSTEVIDGAIPQPEGEGSLTQPIFESAKDLVRIINQFTLVSKASAKPGIRQEFNMGTTAGRALERVAMKIREKGATVSQPDSWPAVRGDPSYSEAVWVGLLENALSHAGEAPRIELGWEQEGEGHRFWVRDDGPGVPPEKQRSLFHPFHRLHEPSAARGLGLPIVGRLVHLQGGLCGYEAGSPTGSCFFFRLPR
jgi:K+-sensing histidine kinase KdpD